MDADWSATQRPDRQRIAAASTSIVDGCIDYNCLCGRFKQPSLCVRIINAPTISPVHTGAEQIF